MLVNYTILQYSGKKDLFYVYIDGQTKLGHVNNFLFQPLTYAYQLG